MAGCCEYGNETLGFINCGVSFFFRRESPLSSIINMLYIFISVFNQLDAQNLFQNKFYYMPLHDSSTCARNM